MKTSSGAGASLLAAMILAGCAAPPVQGAEVRVRTIPPSFEDRLAEGHRKSGHRESPLVRACKGGSSKACNELGDRLTIKHAYPEARQWYVTSCERIRSAMVPSAERLVQLSRDLTHVGSGPKTAELKQDASEIRAGIQGCFDAGETLRSEGEPKQSLPYYDTVCEFSALVEAIGEAVPGFQQVTEKGCAAGESARAELTSSPQFSPQLFVGLARQDRQRASGTQGEASMVFNEGDL